MGAGRWEPWYSLGTFPLRFPHGEEPDDAGRQMAQPPLMPATPYELERADGACSAVEIAIRRGLGQQTPGPDGDDTGY
ncbi:hypothetical protein GCM10010218_59980 [Streptomyces mashuensis]|uniref:Uncharacterized protein n=1 Tax=Streptomyces mashuensis TaxID=33904 RepID=A0A919B9V5_9ACTN|nr:hypothetical protein GCM10010218_59980 [Streptomyces mashuensis]